MSHTMLSGGTPPSEAHHGDLHQDGAARSDTGAVFPSPLRDGELYFRRCRWCRTAAYQCLLCPVCASTSLDWERSDGVGVVRHSTVVGRSTGAPRTLAVIDMAEGFRMRSTVVDVAPDTVHAGTRVRISVEPDGRQQRHVFRPCGTEDAGRS